ncbi:hypothetical protein L210DRAFT_3651144 [Boletus edulis BED1]|uniref:Uncharacterized protein n=1 Tax=Boletus edulis BED1 TaxID=1328754 RepID=A0AAD4G9J5_BOLED|nr:hypothetical protein L210DRAFT_3651144 [Boletus edulis BED1]
MSDILTFARPLSSDDPKAILKSANKLIWDVMKTVADDKDTLQAKTVGYCLNQLHICQQRARERAETLENRTVIEGFANEWKEEAKAHTTRRGWAMRGVYARDEL